MSKKDYILIANTINETLKSNNSLITNQDDKFNAIESIVFNLSKSLKIDNKAFNRQRFYDACMKS